MPQVRTRSNAEKVELFFKQHPNTTYTLAAISREIGISGAQVKSAIYYLTAKHKAGNAIEIRSVERGVSWRYVPDHPKPGRRKLSPEKAEVARRTMELHQVVADQYGGIEEATKKSAEGSLRIGEAVQNTIPPSTKDFNRMVDALGHKNEPSKIGAGLAKLTAELASMHPKRVLQLEIIGETPEGWHIAKDADTGSVFKVVPV